MFKFRPWGFWIVLWQWPLFSKGPRYKLKLLYFKVGGAISLQRHFERSEAWRVILGAGDVILRKTKDKATSPELINFGLAVVKTEGETMPFREEFGVSHLYCFTVPAKFWHKFTASTSSLILETQRGICMESDIERA